MKNLTLIIFILASIQSCDPSKDITEPVLMDIESSFLTFENETQLEKYVLRNKELSTTERRKHEENKNFLSLLTIHENYNAELEELFEEHVDKEVTKDFVDLNAHSEILSKYSNSFVEKSDGWFTLNLFQFEIASALNKDGLVRIGNRMYQYKLDELKSIAIQDESLVDFYVNSLQDADITDAIEEDSDHYLTSDEVNVGKVKAVSLDDLENNANARISYGGSCSDSWLPKVEGSLSFYYVRNTFSKTFTSVCNQSMRLTWFGIGFSASKRMRASYKIRGGSIVQLPNYDASSPTISRTIFSITQGEPVDLSQLSTSYIDADPNAFASCPINFIDTSCDNVSCPYGYRCENGQCVNKCAGVLCISGYQCVNGWCELDPNDDGCLNRGCPPNHSCLGNTCIPW